MCRFATTATVFQSEWSLNQTRALGHEPVAPAVIGNAPDPLYYHRFGRRPFELKPVRFSSPSHVTNERFFRRSCCGVASVNGQRVWLPQRSMQGEQRVQLCVPVWSG